ncbi:MAG TPA: histidine kinase dimerization/phospho-acceptor domain-containing protein, partial [Alphaproteobacteria bacterium]|nr:histidine kinase dimerization/phospho-acceptor domain-containing protein [Alphaproteobacteria bacterium]
MALLFTLLLTAAACILGYFLVDFGRQDFLRETEAAIDIEIRTLANLESHTPAAITAYITRREAHDKTVKFRYENERGAWLAGTIDPVPTALKKLTEGVLRFDWQADSGQETFAAKIHTFVDGSRIIVARNIDDLIASYHRLQYFSVLIMFLMLGVILVSFGISYFVVSRINRIAATAQQIVDTGDLSRRIGIDSEWDDLSNLSRVLNGFLERIEILMHSAREVSNSIAHDLRTPLAGLRGEIETLKGGKASDEKIDAILADADRILSIFQAILRIANLQRASREQFRSHV